MSHPESCNDPTCNLSYRDHLMSVGIGVAALATRKPEAHQTNIREKRWERDIPAYKRLRAQGYTPKRVDGARALEKYAKTESDVNGQTMSIKVDYSDGTDNYPVLKD